MDYRAAIFVRRTACACLAALSIVFVGCAASTGAPEPPPPNPPASDGSARAQMTAKQCEANGGSVVGDIGDGATQRPDYVCPAGGAPRGNIVAEPSGPINIEGAVCCPK